MMAKPMNPREGSSAFERWTLVDWYQEGWNACLKTVVAENKEFTDAITRKLERICRRYSLIRQCFAVV